MIGWSVFYRDTVYHGTRPADTVGLPRQGVQAIVIWYSDEFKTLIMGEDEYYVPNSHRTLYGKEIPFAEFDALIKRIHKMSVPDELRGD